MDTITLAYRERMDPYTQSLMDFGYVPPGLRAKKIFKGIGRFLSSTYKVAEKITKATAKGTIKAYNYTAPIVQEQWKRAQPVIREEWEKAKPALKEAGKELWQASQEAYTYAKPRVKQSVQTAYTKANEKITAYALSRAKAKQQKEDNRNLISLMVANNVLGYSVGRPVYESHPELIKRIGDTSAEIESPIEKNLESKLASVELPESKKENLYETNLARIKSAAENSTEWNQTRDLAYRIYQETGNTDNEANWAKAQEKLANEYSATTISEPESTTITSKPRKFIETERNSLVLNPPKKIIVPEKEMIRFQGDTRPLTEKLYYSKMLRNFY